MHADYQGFVYNGSTTVDKRSENAFNNWKKSTGSTQKNNKLLKHAASDSHKMAKTFRDSGRTMDIHTRTVYSMIKSQSDEEKMVNLNRMADFTDAAYFLFKNEIPHTTKYGSLLELIARLDNSRVIQNFMSASPLNASYTSHNSAVELLEAVSESLSSTLLARVKESPAIAIMADESTDLRTRNELPLCVRFVEDGRAVEAFLALQQLQSTTAMYLKDTILTFLKAHQIPLDKVFWLAFDGASNMSGRKNGVQALLRREDSTISTAAAIYCT